MNNCDLAVSALSTISNLISKALSDDFISDKEQSLILLEFATFTRMNEEHRIKSKRCLEKANNVETEANELLREIRLLFRLVFVFETMFNFMFKTMFEKN